MGRTLIVNHAATRARQLALVRRALELTDMLHRPKTTAPTSNRLSYVGFDPVRWIGRLQDVNNASQFTEREKNVIHGAFSNLIRQLVEIKNDTAPST